MHALILTTVLIAQPGEPIPVKLESIPLKEAEMLHGKRVTATFLVAGPAFTWGEGENLITVASPRSTDGLERFAVLKGDRLSDVDYRDKVKVVGTLRVIRHPESVIGGQRFGRYTEIRIDER